MSLLRRKRRHTAPKDRTPDDQLVPMAWTDPWTPTHRELEALWMEIAHSLGYLVHVTHDSRGEDWRADSGWPDVVVVRGARGYAIEIKVPPDDLTDEQRAWLAELGRLPGFFSGVFRSSGDKARDMIVIADILRTHPPTLPRNEASL